MDYPFNKQMTYEGCSDRMRESRIFFMSIYIKTIVLLLCSNIFMTFAWYAHLKGASKTHLIVAIIFSWALAFFEYLFQVPANRIGFQSGAFNLAQLKITQEVITLSVFVPFALFYMNQPFTLNYIWAGLCLVGAAYFIFK